MIIINKYNILHGKAKDRCGNKLVIMDQFATVNAYSHILNFT